MASLADINSQVKNHEAEIAKLRKQAEELRNQERSGIIEELRKKIAEYGLTAGDLKLSGRASKRTPSIPGPKAAAKYRGPNGESWSGGRGRKPRWITEALASGKSLTEFEIK